MKSYKKNYQIAIDGPAGSGKSTIAKLLAKKLGFLYIDSGAMYRAVTLYLINNKLLDISEEKLGKCLKKITISLKEKNNKQIIFLNNADVTKNIRSSIVNKHVSEISSKKAVRKEMVKRQREIAKDNNVVMDGRDIGTHVFQNANLKIYLTANTYIRAKRRRKDLLSIAENTTVRELVRQIQSRDNYDSTRVISPLCKSQDSILIDSTKLTIDKVLEEIISFLPASIILGVK